MMKKVEFLVGVFALIALVSLVLVALKFSNLSSQFDKESTFEVSIPFSNIGGLKVGSKVSIAGVRVGQVSKIELNDFFDAKVHLIINNQYNGIPVDSFVQISTSGLLGEQYISIDASSGFEDEFWKDGAEIEKQYAGSALSLEKIVSQFLYSAGD